MTRGPVRNSQADGKSWKQSHENTTNAIQTSIHQSSPNSSMYKLPFGTVDGK